MTEERNCRDEVKKNQNLQFKLPLPELVVVEEFVCNFDEEALGYVLVRELGDCK